MSGTFRVSPSSAGSSGRSCAPAPRPSLASLENKNPETLEGRGLIAKWVGSGAGRPARHTPPLPLTRGNVIVNGSPGTHQRRERQSLEIPVAPLLWDGH